MRLTAIRRYKPYFLILFPSFINFYNRSILFTAYMRHSRSASLCSRNFPVSGLFLFITLSYRRCFGESISFPLRILKTKRKKQNVQRISHVRKNFGIFGHKNAGNRQLPISGIFIIFSYIHFIRASGLLQHPILQNIVIPQKFSNDRLIDLSEQRLFQQLKRHRKLHLKRGLSVHEFHRAV